jgi:amidase
MTGSIGDISCTELASQIRARMIDIPSLVEAHLDRADESTESAAAFVTVCHDEARRAAIIAQRALEDEKPLGPLHGVPITVKDIIATAGVRTTAGSRLLADHIPGANATAVSRLLGAGAILIGKTNCPEFAFGITTSSPSGSTPGPFSAAYSAGGSSGGEAYAVAVGASALGLGTDYGGSLRWPAQCTGILALRPTPGRVPTSGQIPGQGGGLAQHAVAPLGPGSVLGRLSVIGPLARSVDDLELALRILSGPDGLDGLAAPVPLLPSRDVDPSRLPIGWLSTVDESPIRAEVHDAMEALATTLASDGLEIRDARGVLDGLHERYNALRDLDPLDDLRVIAQGREDQLTFESRATLDRLGPVDPEVLAETWEERRTQTVRVMAALEDTPLLVLPVAPGPACDLDGSLTVRDRVVSGWELMSLCRAVTYLGGPAASVPIATSSEGLPLSVQVVGRPWHEHEVLALARLLEATFGGWQPPGGRRETSHSRGRGVGRGVLPAASKGGAAAG